MPSGLKIREIRVGTGAIAERGMTALVHYRISLNRGEVVRSSYDDGEPCTFRIGRREVIAGLEWGVVGMQVGGTRELRVSPHLGYRDQPVSGIPANAVLMIEVELLELRTGANDG